MNRSFLVSIATTLLFIGLGPDNGYAQGPRIVPAKPAKKATPRRGLKLKRTRIIKTKKAKAPPKKAARATRATPSAAVMTIRRATVKRMGRMPARRTVRSRYRRYERKVSPAVQARLKKLRKTAREKKWKFDMSPTTAIERDSKTLFMKPADPAKLKA